MSIPLNAIRKHLSEERLHPSQLFSQLTQAQYDQLKASRTCVRSYKGMRPLSGCPGAWAKARSGRSARACDAHEVPGR